MDNLNRDKLYRIHLQLSEMACDVTDIENDVLNGRDYESEDLTDGERDYLEELNTLWHTLDQLADSVYDFIEKHHESE